MQHSTSRGSCLPVLGHRHECRGRRAEPVANHGSLVVADDLLSAADAAEEIEETARLWLLLRHQSTRPLTHAQFTALVEARPQNVPSMQAQERT